MTGRSSETTTPSQSTVRATHEPALKGEGFSDTGDTLAVPASSPSRLRNIGRVVGRFTGFRRGENGNLHPSTDIAAGHAEQYETASSGPLNVTGAQLRGLVFAAMTVKDHENYLYGKGVRPSKVAAVSAGLQTRLNEAVMAGDSQAVGAIVGKLDFKDGGAADHLTTSLESDVTLGEVLSAPYDREFLSSLSSGVTRHTELPQSSEACIIPDLGIASYADPAKNILTVSVSPYSDTPSWKEMVDLPLDKQHFEWVKDADVYGTEQEAFRSQLEVFGELAKRGDTVYTHMTGVPNLPGFLMSEEWGDTTLGAADKDLRGLMVEKGKLADAEAYERALGQIAAGTEPDAPVTKSNGASSVVSSHYVKPGELNPVILFDGSLPDQRETAPSPVGISITGKIRFDDPSLVGIWVTPTYRENLLHWIAGWPEARKERVFRGRPPETILISAADQLSVPA